MKKVNVKKLLTLALAICLTFTSAYAFAPKTALKVHAAGSITNPTPMQPTTDYSGNWNELRMGQHDCYKVTLPSDGKFTVTLLAQNSTDIVCRIRKSQSLDHASELENVTVTCEVANSPSSNTVSTILSAGTYYITVQNVLGAGKAQYKLKTIYENFGFSETPDSYDSPKTMAVGGTYTDALTKTDAEDWYRLTIAESGKYSFRYSAAQSTVLFKLKDVDLREVAGKDCYENSSEAEDVFLNAGTYYLHISGWPSKYSFSLNNAKISESSITKVKALTNKKVDVTFKNASDVTGYEIRYSTDKNFRKNVKSKTFKLNKTKTAKGSKKVYTIKKLKKNKKYYFQIRTYEETNGVKSYSAWSKSKNVKVK
jgi:hypothetical protein